MVARFSFADGVGLAPGLRRSSGSRTISRSRRVSIAPSRRSVRSARGGLQRRRTPRGQLLLIDRQPDLDHAIASVPAKPVGQFDEPARYPRQCRPSGELQSALVGGMETMEAEIEQRQRGRRRSPARTTDSPRVQRVIRPPSNSSPRSASESEPRKVAAWGSGSTIADTPLGTPSYWRVPLPVSCVLATALAASMSACWTGRFLPASQAASQL